MALFGSGFLTTTIACALIMISWSGTGPVLVVGQGWAGRGFGSWSSWPQPRARPRSSQVDTSPIQFPGPSTSLSPKLSQRSSSSSSPSPSSSDRSDEESIRRHHREHCCTTHFKGIGKRCFDMTKCDSGGGGGKSGGGWGWGYGWGFGEVPTHDVTQEGICNCMGTSRKKNPRVCCKNEDPPTPAPKAESTTILSPMVQMRTATYSPAVTVDDANASIHSLEWTSSTKSTVLTHRNLHLLPALDSCGLAKARSGRITPYIIGGVKSKFGQHPWMALLGLQCAYPDEPDSKPLFFYGCGGVLINSRYVLTAAHCVVPAPKPAAVQCKVTTVRLGEYDQGRDPDCDPATCAPPVQNLDVNPEGIVAHSEYSLKTQENDIALIRLAKPVTLGDFVAPICLPVHDFVKMGDQRSRIGAGTTVGDRLTVAGWGRTVHDKEKGSDVLQEVKVPIVGRGKCQEYFKPAQRVVTDGRFCAGGELSRDSCNGDSGGPIMGRVTLKSSGGDGTDAQTSTRMVALGLVSLGRGDSQCSMAGEGHLTLYTKMAHYLPWILDHIKP